MSNKHNYSAQNLYSKNYNAEWFEKANYEQSRYLIDKIKNLKVIKGKRLLDAGCGVGILCKFLKDTYGKDVYGTEMNKIAVKEARDNGVKAVLADLEKKWPYEDKYFDTVISVQVIEHIINPDFFLQEAWRVLKNEGIVILTTPNLASWFNRIIFLFGFQPFTLEVSTVDKTLGLKFTRKLTSNREPLGHVRGFTLRALQDILELHNFTLIKSIGGEVNYLPKYMKPFDKLFSYFPGLSSDLIVIAKKNARK